MELTNQLPQEEKIKVAYALNLCAVSISQIIDSRDMVVLKQERESILNNLNLQNFVKHPALFDVLKRILDTITFLEIQAGDLSFIEREYQQKLKNAIWAAVPNPGILVAGGEPITLAIGIATQIGIGYMNYRRNKNEYKFDKDRSEWALMKHEIEQLQGLRAQLFETAWKLSSDYDFDDKYRLTERQLSRYSAALLEPDPLKRYERLDVMSENFAAFPPFWYYKGNAAMEIFKNKKYADISANYKNTAIGAYTQFRKRHFEFLREDVTAAACCLEHLSLLDKNDHNVEKLLQQALKFARDNYDVLQQSVLVNIRLKNTDAVIIPLREMIANGYNVGLNSLILGRIYINNGNRSGYDTLRHIVGRDNIPKFNNDNRSGLDTPRYVVGSDNTPKLDKAQAEKAEKKFLEKRTKDLTYEFNKMLRDIFFLLNLRGYSPEIHKKVKNVVDEMNRYCSQNNNLIQLNNEMIKELHEACINVVGGVKEDRILSLQILADQVSNELKQTQFPLEPEKVADLIDKIKKATN
ncbi:MAG: hypothetical protein FWG63_02375 [Defluviitaleaceae bacterium]|nr:hypothetical protein [Defluviitaleaceae bacterium]